MSRHNARREAAVILLIDEVRLLFHRLSTIADNLHEDVGITASMRAVMESLNRFGPQTVPQIAEQKSVSRQHIQTIVNQLFAGDLVVFETNPNHKRSQQVRLSAKGVNAFEAIRLKEAPLLSSIADGLTEAEVATARAVLAKMIAATM